MVLPMARPWKHPVTQIYWFRKAVPEDLRQEVGKREVKFSLGTRDKREATRVHALKHAAILESWAALRSLNSGKQPHASANGTASEVRSLRAEQIEALAGEIYAQYCEKHREPARAGILFSIAILDEHRLKTIDGESPEGVEPEPSERPALLEDAHGRRVDALLAKHALIIDDISRQKLLYAAQRAARQAVTFARKRDQGDYRPDPDADRFPKLKLQSEPDRQTLSLTTLYDEWAAARKPEPETVTAWRSIILKFIAFVGYDDALRVTEDEIAKWRDHLRSQKITGARIKKAYLACVKTVFGWAKSEKKVPSNPARDVKVTVEKTRITRRKDFTDEEVFIILKAALGPHDGKQSHETKAARRWVPWLCAYTGARVAEITSLRKEDIVLEDGIHGISISKTKTALPRQIPLHPDIVAQGFLKFVNGRESGPLFYDARLTRKDLAHKTRSEGLAEWVRELGVTDKRVKPHHAWRQRFKTESRRVGMDPEIRDYIQGHRPRTVGEEYGHIPFEVTYAWLKLLPSYDVTGSALRIVPSKAPHPDDAPLQVGARARRRPVRRRGGIRSSRARETAAASG